MLNAVEFLVRVKDGKIPRKVSEAIRDKLAAMEGKTVTIILGEWKRPRSNKQNAYMWGVVIPRIHKVFVEAGNDVTKEQVHEYLKEYVGKLTDVLILPNGQKRIIVRSTASLNVSEWEIYMHKCRAFAAEVLNIQIPEPGEVLGDDVEGEQR
jgi:hypothetical protein